MQSECLPKIVVLFCSQFPEIVAVAFDLILSKIAHNVKSLSSITMEKTE